MKTFGRVLERLGKAACVIVLLTAAVGCGGDDDGGVAATPTRSGSKAPATATRPPATSTIAAATATSAPATGVPTATATPVADFAGEYAASFNLEAGLQAYLNLEVDDADHADGTLEIVDPDSAALGARAARGLFISVGLVTISGDINPASGTFSFGGNINTPDGNVPFSLSGTLPGPGGGGSATLTVNGESYTTDLSLGAGPTPLPTSSVPSPTPGGEGCVGGHGTLTFSNVSGDNNANQPLDSLTVSEGSGNLTVVGALAIFGANISKCPVEEFGVSRGFSIGVSGAAVVPGATFELNNDAIPPNLFGYSEATAGPSLQVWNAASGTLTIDAVDGNVVRFHVSNAQMEPGAPFLFGPPPLGTFTLDLTAEVEVMINN